MVWTVLLWTSVFFGKCLGANILVLSPLPTYSHFIVMEPLFQELAARGHQITVFSRFPQKKLLPNYADVDISTNETSRLSFTLEEIQKKMPNTFATIHFIEEISRFCDLIKQPNFQEILNKDGKKYDLIITEIFGPDCMTYFAYKLKIPLISYTTCAAVPWASERFGIPDNPSYIPNFLFTYPPEMTLWQRTLNTIILLYSKYWLLYFHPKEHRRISEESFGEHLPPLHEVVANTSLYFVNSYHALTQSRPYPPNVIEIGGIHIKKRKPLPKDLETILDNAKDGVIIVSFGSMVKATTISKSVINMFMKVFATIPQTVIMKYEEDLPSLPSNVILKNWLPQRDMMEHENVKAIIGHGGLASTIEAVYFNKPFIGIPFFGDQYNNIFWITQKDAGIQLDLDSITEEKLSQAVRDVTTNQKYIEGMQKMSQRFRDRPMTALQSAVYWTEYVIRHKGAPHLRPASVSLPLYQYLLLDVIFLLLSVLIVFICVLYFIIKKIVRIIICSSKKTKKD